MEAYDLVIVGGGVVGASLAVALKETSLKIALIDARLPALNDPRLFALNHSSCQLLKNLNIWPELVSHAAPIKQVHISNQGCFGATRLQCEELQLETLGHVIPAYFIETALENALKQLPISLYRPAELKSLTQTEAGSDLSLTTANGNINISAKWVVAADGTDSTVRQQLGIKAEVVDYQQSALVTRTILHRSHNHTAYERFTKQGVIAMLPLSADEPQCATIWSGNKKEIAALLSLSDEAFLQALQSAFGNRLGKFKAIYHRHCYPLRMVKAEKTVSQNILLIGNAAHTLHPVAAQGFNLSLYEVAVLVEMIKTKQHHHLSLTKQDLAAVGVQLASQSSRSMQVSHTLAQIFTGQSLLVKGVLQAGLIGLDINAPIKKKFLKTLMGMSGSVPRLLLQEAN